MQGSTAIGRRKMRSAVATCSFLKNTLVKSRRFLVLFQQLSRMRDRLAAASKA
jgi:hypothetical protein